MYWKVVFAVCESEGDVLLPKEKFYDECYAEIGNGGYTGLLLITKGLRGAIYVASEVFAEEAGAGEIQFVGNSAYLQITVAQHHLCRGYHRSVNPFLSRYSAYLTNDSAQIALGDA